MQSEQKYFLIAYAMNDDQPACVGTLRETVDNQVDDASRLTILALPLVEFVIEYPFLDIVPRSIYVFAACNPM